MGFPLNNNGELSEAFSLFIYLDANKFVFLTFFFLIMMIYSKVSTRREREERDAWRQENGFVACYSCGRCINRELANYLFSLSRKKKNKRKNKVAAFKGLITSRWSGNELVLLPQTKREWACPNRDSGGNWAHCLHDRKFAAGPTRLNLSGEFCELRISIVKNKTEQWNKEACDVIYFPPIFRRK